MDRLPTFAVAVAVATSIGVAPAGAPKPEKAGKEPAIVVAGEVKLTIAAGTKVIIVSVKTAQGERIRLTTPAVRVEATFLRYTANGKVVELQVNDGVMEVTERSE